MMKETMAKRKYLFLSSVQKELQHERRTIKEFLEGDALLRRYFEVFLFEDLSASDRKADNVYLEEVRLCDVYVGLFGNEYGSEDAEGISPTEREFDLASAKGKFRLIFIKGTDDNARNPKMLKLIHKSGFTTHPPPIHRYSRFDNGALCCPGRVPGTQRRSPHAAIRCICLPPGDFG